MRGYSRQALMRSTEATERNSAIRVRIALSEPSVVPYRRLPVVTFTSFPIDSPDTTSSTRRFSCRPAELSFEATGNVLPNPVAVIDAIETPCCTR